MKKHCFIFFAVFSLLFVACGGSSVKIDDNLSSEEAQVVIKTEKSLPRGSKIESYQVVKSKLPLAMMDGPYKTYRDQANKARIDYRTNITRGLDQVAQKNLETLQNIQSQIVEKASNLETTSPEFIFVLANVKEKSRRDGNLTAYISVFDAQNLQQDDLVQVTTPLYNNAVMITEALNGKLSEPNPETAAENLSSSNPVVNFILQSNPK